MFLVTCVRVNDFGEIVDHVGVKKPAFDDSGLVCDEGLRNKFIPEVFQGPIVMAHLHGMTLLYKQTNATVQANAAVQVNVIEQSNVTE